MNKTFSVIGGDLRQLTLARLLEKDGISVKIFGFDKEIEAEGLERAETVYEAAQSDIIILPLPVTQDGKNLNAPFAAEDIELDELFDKIKAGTIVFGGKVSPETADKCKIPIYDYFIREELSILNAVPTAEGAIETALAETAHTLFKSKCLIIGYGRIGKILAHRLQALGVLVSVSARKCEDFAWINAFGYNCMDSRDLNGKISDYDIIINTVPSVILNGELLKQIPKSTLVIDLASKPGGVDFNLAKELGLKVIWALSLPGKTAPITSGEIIKDTIINILKEMEAI